MTRLRRVAVFAALSVVCGACTRTVVIGGASPTPTTSSLSASPSASPTTADQRPPCKRPPNQKSKPKRFKKKPLPQVIAEVAHQVEEVRGLKFIRPIAPRAVSREEMDRLLNEGLNEAIPKGEARRTGLAWQTIGVIPEGADLRQAYKDFGASSIVGFYDTDDHRLVYVGTQSPTPLQRRVLAHELTHALDDQHFKLDHLDDLHAKCRDELALSFLSLVEGNAEVTATRWATRNLTPAEYTQLQVEESSQGEGGLPSTVPLFFAQLLIFPYPNGSAFVTDLLDRGGTKEVDAAFRHPPVSTEQILHPGEYPADVPDDVEVPDLAPKLGAGWKDLEFEDVGEGWLHLMFDLRIGPEESTTAVSGWDGAQYRAWGHRKDTAVVLDTAWDSSEDAKEFAGAMDEWIGTHVGTVLRPSDTHVRVLFASDEKTLALLRRAAG
ncbi:MAG TPA: hypothetical protein VF660_08710 [Actinomycetota bacterium]